MTDKEDPAYARARKRAKDKLDFYNHLLIYVVVIGCLYVLNWITLPEYYWAKWAAFGWGIGLAVHAATTYFGTDDPAVLDAMTERELEKERKARGE